MRIASNGKNILDMFRVVEASKLSLNDKFLQHNPKTERQAHDKEEIMKAIKVGLVDFRKPILDPSVDEDGNIFFEAGNNPATGYSLNWWSEKAKELIPDKNSRVGEEAHHYAFIATLIKYLIDEEKYEIGDAWRAVCDNSIRMGHYWNSEDSKHTFETTGKRPVGGWFDLSNTLKLLKDDDGTPLLASGCYCYDSGHFPVSKVEKPMNPSPDAGYGYCVGWLICDA